MTQLGELVGRHQLARDPMDGLDGSKEFTVEEAENQLHFAGNYYPWLTVSVRGGTRPEVFDTGDQRDVGRAIAYMRCDRDRTYYVTVTRIVAQERSEKRAENVGFAPIVATG